MKTLKNILILIGMLIGVVVGFPALLALGAWAVEFMLRCNLLPKG